MSVAACGRLEKRRCAQRPFFKSAVWPLQAFQDENLSTRWSPSHFFLEEAMTFTEFLCPTDHVVQPHPTCSAADS